MADKAQPTIHIKWVRSGIGFTKRQKGVIRSLGFRRLNEVVERPDTPQTRGLVAKIPHLVKIVKESAEPAWASVAEYTLGPPEVAPTAATARALELVDAAVATAIQPEAEVPAGEKATAAPAGAKEQTRPTAAGKTGAVSAPEAEKKAKAASGAGAKASEKGKKK